MSKDERTPYQLAVQDVCDELDAATSTWPPMNSAHEGYGVMAEEWTELEKWVFTSQKKRDLKEMRYEAIQLAAMAIRFAAEVCNEDVGRR